MSTDPIAYFTPQLVYDVENLTKSSNNHNEIKGEILPYFSFKQWLNKRKNIKKYEFHTLESEIGVKILEILSTDKYRKGPIENLLISKKDIISKIDYFVNLEKPIELVMPAFPGRTFNILTHSRLKPDLGELESLCLFFELNQHIKNIYPYGLKFIFIQNTEVYAPFYGYTPEGLNSYYRDLQRMVNKIEAVNLFHFINMKDLLEERKEEFEEVFTREKEALTKEWKEKNIEQRNKVIEAMALGSNTIAANAAAIKLIKFYNGTDKDFEGYFIKLKEAMHTRAESTALNFAAFLKTIDNIKLIAKKFPNSIRSTVHPKPGQYSPNFVNENCNIVPWHGVAVLKSNGEVESVYESTILENPHQYKAVYIDGEYTPFYYKKIELNQEETINES